MNKFHWKNKLNSKLKVLIIGSFIISALFYFGLYQISNLGLDYHFDRGTYLTEKEKAIAEEFARYVRDNNISMYDLDRIDEWVQEQHSVYIGIYKEKDSVLIYDSDDGALHNPVDTSKHIISFSDGEATTYVIDYSTYKYYRIAYLFSLLLSLLLFIFIMSIGMKKVVGYVVKLEEEVKILEGGDLDYHITIKGEDELASLAASIDDMRLSLLNKVKNEEELFSDNRRLIVSISHDLKTPLTTLLLYAEFMKKKKYKTQNESEKFVEKIWEKTKQLETMTDKMLNYFILQSRDDLATFQMSVDKELKNNLSDMSTQLKNQGFTVVQDFESVDGDINVIDGYIDRINDNILSNILRHADIEHEIIIALRQRQNLFELVFRNHKTKIRNGRDSTGIGLSNIKSMMNVMNGKVKIVDEGDIFELTLIYPKKK